MSKKFKWKTYDVPRCHPWHQESDQQPVESFTIRHLKQGAPGAVQTWPAAEVLLEYLVQRGGLRDVVQKLDGTAGENANGILDMMDPPSWKDKLDEQSNTSALDQSFNIVELGGGTGFLSVGLALALNDITSTDESSSKKIRLICTDNDRATIKNMRHNVTQQPVHRHVNKAVRIEPLDWGNDVGGAKFSSAVESQFRCRKMGDKREKEPAISKDEPPNDDPIRLLSHLIASDVLYGETTLEPLSSIVAAVKLRNPSVIVVLLLKDRKPNAVAELKELIETKVEQGLESSSPNCRLQNFKVNVRNVLHKDVADMKLVEC